MNECFHQLQSFLDNLLWMKFRVIMQAKEEGRLPIYLGSALRGVIGPRMEIILGNETHHSPHSQLLIDTRFLNRRIVKKGDPLSFEICLLGDFRPHLKEIVFILGHDMCLGEKKILFSVVDIQFVRSPSLRMENGAILLFPQISCGKSLTKKAKQHKDMSMAEIEILSPMRLRNKGTLLTQFDTDIFFRRLWDRVSRYDQQSLQRVKGSVQNTPHFDDLTLTHGDNQWFSLEGLSYRQEKLHSLSGLVGQYRFGPMTPERWALLFAGELLHVGEKTNFGLGRYRILKAGTQPLPVCSLANTRHETEPIEGCYVEF